MCDVCGVEKPDVLGEYPQVSHMHVVTHAMPWMPFKSKSESAASYLSAIYSDYRTTPKYHSENLWTEKVHWIERKLVSELVIGE